MDICVVPLTLAVIIMLDGTCQPLLQILSRRNVYLMVLR